MADMLSISDAARPCGHSSQVTKHKTMPSTGYTKHHPLGDSLEMWHSCNQRQLLAQANGNSCPDFVSLLVSSRKISLALTVTFKKMHVSLTINS